MQSQIDQKALPTEADGVIPKASAMRLPVKLPGPTDDRGQGAADHPALNRMIAMRSYQRSVHRRGHARPARAGGGGMTEDMAKEMYRYLAIANYEDRFVIPTSKEEMRGLPRLPGSGGLLSSARRRSASPPNFAVPERRKESMERASGPARRRVARRHRRTLLGGD